jgi:hypothetical protein
MSGFYTQLYAPEIMMLIMLVKMFLTVSAENQKYVQSHILYWHSAKMRFPVECQAITNTVWFAC